MITNILLGLILIVLCAIIANCSEVPSPKFLSMNCPNFHCSPDLKMLQALFSEFPDVLFAPGGILGRERIEEILEEQKAGITSLDTKLWGLAVLVLVTPLVANVIS